MVKAVEDLWPKEITESKKITVPGSIAIQQADLLGIKTKNVVTAQVVPLITKERGLVVFGFNVVAPSLNNYKLRLFSFHYRLDKLYPVTAYNFGVRGFKESMEAADEAAWKALLKVIFSHESVISVIQALRSQSEDLGSESSEDDIPF